ncbi:MAG TPA: nuclear transport factor 2 family protein [Planctomycetota bacterium]
MHIAPLEAVRQYYASLAPGHRNLLMALLDPGVVVEIQEGLPGVGGKYVGLKAYLEDFLFNLYGAFDLRFDVQEFLASGERVVALGRSRGTAVATGAPVDVPFVHVWTVRDGRLVHALMFTDTATLCAATQLHATR